MLSESQKSAIFTFCQICGQEVSTLLAAHTYCLFCYPNPYMSYIKQFFCAKCMYIHRKDDHSSINLS